MRNSNPVGEGSETRLALGRSRLFRMSGAAIVSIAVGIGIGLMIAWGFWPVEFVNADPSDLRPRHKEDYVRMISAAYVADGDLATAKDRLNWIGLNLSAKDWVDLISREKKSGRDLPTLDALALFAQGLGFDTIPLAAPSNSAEVGASKATISSQTIPSFRLAERTMLTCVEEPNEPHLRLFVRDEKGRDLANIAIEIRWANGEDTVYTGLKPERGAGYADYEATTGTFTITLPNTQSDIAGNLIIGEPPTNCRNDRGQTPRGWKLVFQQK